MEDERSLRAYLLGKSPAEDQRRIEERLLGDDQYIELLLVVEAEMIDGYVRGEVPETERREFESRFLSTPERRRKLRMARSLRRYVNNTTSDNVITVDTARVSWWRTALTPAWRVMIAVMVALGGIGLWRIAFVRESLVAQGRSALKSAFKESPVETRLSGFNWPPPSATRGAVQNPTELADPKYLNQAQGALHAAYGNDSGAESEYALGQLLLVEGKVDEAIKHLEHATAATPNNAKLHSDLGAALLEQAKTDQRQQTGHSLEHLAEALEHFNRARSLDAKLLEALFNRALCYQTMELPTQAEADWKGYLEQDSRSEWAEVARQNLTILEQQKQKRSARDKEDIVEEFLKAYRAGDALAAGTIVRENREMITGRVVWWQILGRFFRSNDDSQSRSASELLNALRYVGELEMAVGSGGDRYTLGVAQFYETTPTLKLASLGQAHSLMNEGHRLYVRTEYKGARHAYGAARRIFEQAGDEWETSLADFWIGFSYTHNTESQESLVIFKRLVDSCRGEGYQWLLAQSLMALARVEDMLGEPSKALTRLREAVEISERLEDSYTEQKGLAQLADLYRKLGDYRESEMILERCVAAMKNGWPGSRQMWRNYDQLTLALMARRRFAAAAEYGTEALRLAQDEMRQKQDSSLVFVSYMYLSRIQGELQNQIEAIRLATASVDAARRLSEEKARRVNVSYASLQLADLYRQSHDYATALDYYNQSVEQLTRDDHPALLYEAYKGRLLCHNQAGDDGATEEDLRATLPLLEQYREKIVEEKDRNSFFAVQQGVYDAGIEYAHRTGNDYAAFNYAEESRARSLLYSFGSVTPANLDEVRQRLLDGVRLIEFAALDGKLLVFSVSKTHFSVYEVNVSLDQLADKVLNFRRLILAKADCSIQARDLYDLLLGPLDLLHGEEPDICFVPDKILNHLPFAALVTPSERYLIQDKRLTISPSATVYLRCSERASLVRTRDERLLVVGNPTFDRSAFPSLPLLPSTAEESERIARYYQLAAPAIKLLGARAREQDVKREIRNADVVHLASHYVVVEESPMKSKLLLAAEPGGTSASVSSPGFLQADEIYGLKPLNARLVVLSACQSGVEYYYGGEGMIGISRVFIAAGVPLVIASLWHVEDEPTRDLMIEFHRLRKEKAMSTTVALQEAQTYMLEHSTERYRHPYYWAGFTPIGGHAWY